MGSTSHSSCHLFLSVSPTVRMLHLPRFLFLMFMATLVYCCKPQETLKSCKDAISDCALNPRNETETLKCSWSEETTLCLECMVNPYTGRGSPTYPVLYNDLTPEMKHLDIWIVNMMD